MKNCIEYLDQVARTFKAAIDAMPHAEPIPTKDYGWENYRWHSPKWRLAHLEIFNQNRFMVVHLCIFPRLDDPNPIFGFDTIAGEQKVTGLFMDLSPTVRATEPFNQLDFGKSRDMPDWGTIFSPHWIAIRPSREELEAVCDQTVQMLPAYVDGLCAETVQDANIRLMQNNYCIHQRKNEHTMRALKNILGDEGAHEFMDEILFPTA